MNDPLDVPVAVFVFARPDLFAQVLAAVRTARPRLLFVVADAPRRTHPEDIANCNATLQLIDSIDWNCEIRRCVAMHNMGCDARLRSGLDWVFGQVEEAIILEDDLVPNSSFFPWCAAMLRRYRKEPKIMQVSGRNELGRWGNGDADHLIVRQGSIWGWATWARAWFGVDWTFHAKEAAQRVLDRLTHEPLLAADFAVSFDLAISGRLAAWDVIWSLGKTLADGLSVVPPINLVTNIGFDARATRTNDEGDLRSAIPSGKIAPLPVSDEVSVHDVDPMYDRWALLLLLMATYRNPKAVRRLAKFSKVRSEGWVSSLPGIGHHLAPFANPKESISVIEHLVSIGTSTPSLTALHAELTLELEQREARSHV